MSTLFFLFLFFFFFLIIVVWWRADRRRQRRARGAANRGGPLCSRVGWPGAGAGIERTALTPRFVLTARPRSPERPTGIDYDPRRLIRIGKRVDDVFAAEPRLTAWAGARERTLRSEIGKDLPPGAAGDDRVGRVPVQHMPGDDRCTRSTVRGGCCRAQPDRPRNHVGRAFILRRSGGPRHARAVRAVQPEHRPDAAYQTWYDEERRKTLAFLRKTPGAIPHLDHARIPEE